MNGIEEPPPFAVLPPCKVCGERQQLRGDDPTCACGKMDVANVMPAVRLEGLGVVVHLGNPVMAVPHSHMLRHRKRRIRRKWRKRLSPEIRLAVVEACFGAIQRGLDTVDREAFGRDLAAP